MAQRNTTSGSAPGIPQSRQETLRIRRALTAYLRSHIVFADDNNPDNGNGNGNGHAQSHLSLCVPHDAVVDVKRPAAELTGLHKEYLDALRANVLARREYQKAAADATSPLVDTNKDGSGDGEGGDPSLELQAYLRLLRDRRRHAKLQVFQHYLQEIRARDTTQLEEFETRESRGKPVVSPFDVEGEEEGGSGGKQREGGIEDLLHKLERAVIRAQAQLSREKKLLEEMKARRRESGDGEVPPGAKLAALQRTRDELVHWVEEKLVTEGDGEESLLQEIPAEEIEESAYLLEEQKTQVAEQYAAYVDARKRLLDAASRACQPITMPSTKSPDRAGEVDKPPASPAAVGPGGEAVMLDPVDVLSFTSENLLPLSKSQRALALQKHYLSGLLAKEKSTTIRILNRLSDESHLLPEYPLLARQPRFKRVTAALGSRHATNPVETTKPDEVVRLAEAWAFASSAAGTNEREYVEQKVVEASEAAQDAEEVLHDVYQLLNQDLQEALRDDEGADPDEGDIWASEAQSTRSRRQSIRRTKRPQGPWSALDGRVGLEEGS